MARRKRRVDVILSLPKYILLFCLLVLYLPSSHTKRYKKPEMNSNFSSALDRTANVNVPASKNTSILYPRTYDKESKHPLLTKTIVLFLIVCIITSNALLVAILSYLNNVSLAKKCVLFYLYKDFVTIWIALNCVWLVASIFYYPTHSSLPFGTFQAKVISFVMSCLTLILFLVINVMNALKLYKVKTKVLDPQMPWGEDEGLGVKIIRVSCGMLVVGLTSTLFALGTYPKIYYVFAEEDPSLFILPVTASVFPGVFVFLLVSCIITCLAAKYYESPNDQLIDKLISSQMNLFVCMILIALMITSLNEVFKVFELVNLWRLLIGLMSSTMVLIPAIVIMKTNRLKCYVIRAIKNSLDEAFLLNIYLTPTFLMVIIYSIIYLV